MNSLPLIDIGVNLTSKRFAQDLDDVIGRAREAGLVHAVVTGTSASESRAALELALEYPDFLSCTAGVHPHNARDWNIDTGSEVRELLRQPQVKAVGECGLDFNRDFSPRDQQENCFAAQLEIAAETGKPVFLHERDAHERFAAILREYRDHLPAVVVHCFTGNKKELFTYLDLDCYLGITGWLCDERRGDELRQAVCHAPLARLMIETDAPYLTPRTLKPRPNRNEPAFLPEVLKALAEILQEPVEDVAVQTAANARAFFQLSV